MKEALRRPYPSRAALSIHDPAFREHCLPLSASYTPAGDIYLADLWYYPNGPEPSAEPLVVDLQAREIGYYHVRPIWRVNRAIWSIRCRCAV